MSWYDPKMARWVEWVLKTIATVHAGYFDSARWNHQYACEAHAAAALHVDVAFPDALGGSE